MGWSDNMYFYNKGNLDFGHNELYHSAHSYHWGIWGIAKI